MSIYRLSRTMQAAVAAVAIVMAGWTIVIVVAIVLSAPSARPREVSAVIAAKLDGPQSAKAAASSRPAQPEDPARPGGAVPALPAVSVNPAAAPGAAAVSNDSAAAPGAAVVSVNPAAAPGAAAVSNDSAAAPGVAVSAPSSDGPDLGTAVIAAAPEEAEAAPRDTSAIADATAGEKLRAQLAAIDDRVFALATRGLGAPPAAEDARAARLAREDGLEGVPAHVANIERHVERLATGVSAFRDAESALLREVQPQLSFFIRTAERVIERSGLDLDEVFRGGEAVQRRSEGGPFVAAVSGPLAAERAALHSDLAHWQALRELVRRMPLAAPLDRYAVSSSFGSRTDPLNNRKATHNGLDLISALGSSIRAPAPGTVVFAGRNGGYGNFIEIDHGRSLRTRYAHLRSIKVKKGDKVDFRQRIGTLGNTGRSTGAHLHYEVLVAGKPVNPMNFIKAGQHVFQE